jgi:anti-sigma factor RsiW
LLVDFSDGELPDEQRNEVAAHVGHCAACADELARLDQSLACLVNGVAITEGPVCAASGASPSRRLRPEIALTAISLACLLAVAFAVWRANRPGPAPIVANVPVASPQEVPTPKAAPAISQADALRRIALLEQQARLQTSLDLMPAGPWYDELRASNQRLLDGFKAATSTFAESPENDPARGETL